MHLFSYKSATPAMQKSLLNIPPMALLCATLLIGCSKEETAPLKQKSAPEERPIASGTPSPEKNSGDPSAQEAKSLPPSVSPAMPDLVTGEKVYKSTCSICHKSGLNGAPRIGKKDDWEARLAQGNEILYERAIKGYRGSKGSMPSRGSNPKLTDAEVKAAVDYMIKYSIPSWSLE